MNDMKKNKVDYENMLKNIPVCKAVDGKLVWSIPDDSERPVKRIIRSRVYK